MASYIRPRGGDKKTVFHRFSSKAKAETYVRAVNRSGRVAARPVASGAGWIVAATRHKVLLGRNPIADAPAVESIVVPAGSPQHRRLIARGWRQGRIVGGQATLYPSAGQNPKRSRFDSYGALKHVSPFKVKVPGLTSGLAIWPAGKHPFLGWRKEFEAWLLTLKLYHLRALQARIGAFGVRVHEELQRGPEFGRKERLEQRSGQLYELANMVVDAIDVVGQRTPGAEIGEPEISTAELRKRIGKLGKNDHKVERTTARQWLEEKIPYEGRWKSRGAIMGKLKNLALSRPETAGRADQLSETWLFGYEEGLKRRGVRYEKGRLISDTPSARRNEDAEPVGWPAWTRGLKRMRGPWDNIVFVDWGNPRWGKIVTASGKKAAAKFYNVYGVGRGGERIHITSALRDELMSSYVAVNPGKRWHETRAEYLRTSAEELERHGSRDGAFQRTREAEEHERAAKIKKKIEGVDIVRMKMEIAAMRRGASPNPGTDMGSIMNTPDFRRATKLYRQVHGCEPTSVKRVILPMGGEKRITDRVCLVSLGKAPAESYEPYQRGSKKHGRIWVHPYDHKPEKAVTSDGRTIITLPGSHGVRAGKDGEAWIHG